jgi:hypothetical protein
MWGNFVCPESHVLNLIPSIHPRSSPVLSTRGQGWRCEKKLNLIPTIDPAFKNLAQSWGWKMIKVHEEMYP